MKYNRVLLKLSGEALMGSQQYGIDPQRLNDYADEIIEAAKSGVQIGIVIGGGNIFRGLQGASKGMDRIQGDYMGMLATVINSMAMQSTLQSKGQKATLLAGLYIDRIAETMSSAKAIRLLEEGHVVLMGAGTGNPFFTTDTAATLRALETDCDAVLKATKVDGVYSADPMKDPNAVRYSELSFDEALEKHLSVMDAAAFSLCRDNDLPVIVFDFSSPDTLERVISGDSSAGTVVS